MICNKCGYAGNDALCPECKKYILLEEDTVDYSKVVKKLQDIVDKLDDGHKLICDCLFCSQARLWLNMLKLVEDKK